MTTLTAAVVQLTSTTNVEDNLARAVHWTEHAAHSGARFIALPENYGFLGPDEEKLPWAQPVDGGAFTAPLRALARKHGVWILAGSIPEQSPEPQRTFNTSVLIDPNGATAATYRKVHLFDVDLPDVTLQESKSVSAGAETVLTPVDAWQVGLSVCYDLRFPELYRQLSAGGAHILTVPAAFTLQTGKDHWDVLLRARAIENQCFVIAPGQFGFHGGKRSSWGKSQIIDPWGTVLALAPEREGVAIAVLDRSDLERVRTRLPALRHRRLKPI